MNKVHAEVNSGLSTIVEGKLFLLHHNIKIL